MATTPPVQSRPPLPRQHSGLGLVPVPIPVVPTRMCAHVSAVAAVAVPHAAPQQQLSAKTITSCHSYSPAPTIQSGRLQRSVSARSAIVRQHIPQLTPVGAIGDARYSGLAGLPCVAAQTASDALQQKEAETESTVPSTPASRLGRGTVLDSSSAGGLLNTSTSAAGPEEESLQHSSLGFRIRTQYARSQTPPPAIRRRSVSPSRAACRSWNLTPSASTSATRPVTSSVSASATPLPGSRTPPLVAFRPLQPEAATDCRDEADGMPLRLTPNKAATSLLPQEETEGAEQPLATEPLGSADMWCGQEELAAETSPGNQHLTSEEGSPDASLATTETATTWQKSELVDSAATCDVADRFGNKNTGLYRELDETRDASLPPPGDAEWPANSQTSNPGNFGVGDVVLANGRLGVVFWDGRPRHDYAMLVWKDDGTESGVRASEIRKAAASGSPHQAQGPPSFKGRLSVPETGGHRSEQQHQQQQQQQEEWQAQLDQLKQEQPLDKTQDVACHTADLTGLSDALSFKRLSDRVAALDLHNQRLRGWRVGISSKEALVE
mmetsp:Transcript_135174/g.263264  ORF Transcript_135174/g.263264 Transcript_135174/m.263264 type:complete len:553 (+) Transcript_135174:850-2508(+)